MKAAILHREWLPSARAQWPYYLTVAALAVLCWQLWHSLMPRDLGKVLRAIESAHAGKELATTEDYVKAWLPRVARAHFFVCLGLLAFGPWLVGREPARELPAPRQPSRWLWVVTGLVIALSAWLNSPRLTQSFSIDEEWTARRVVVGDLHPNAKGSTPSWHKTLFYYIDPNNHPMFSALARLSNSLVPVPQAKNEFAFHEWPIRLPGFLFGLAGLAIIAWLTLLIGIPRAGIIAIIWLALHPWHVRYGVDARGYALLIALLPLSMVTLWRANATGGMGGWLAFGLVEFLVLWTYPGALYFVMILNVVACGMIATGPVPVARWLQWRRYAVGSLIGAMCTSLMLSPCVQPMIIFLKGGRLRGELSAAWVIETISGLMTGIPWAKWEDHDLALAWMRTWEQTPWLVVLAWTALAVALIAGIVAMWHGGREQRWLMALLLSVAPFTFAMARSQGNILYPWYMITSLPGMAIMVGVGADSLGGWCCARRCRWAAPVLFLAIFSMATWGQDRVLREHPVEQMRESVAVTRTERNALTGDLSKVLTGSAYFPARLYDPAAVPLKSVADLRDLMEKADTSSLPLFINFADKEFFKLRDPAMVAFLEDTAKFQALPPFQGVHSQRERRVYRYLGKAE